MTLGERILKSNNNSKTTWDIINELLGKQHTTHDIQKLTIDGNYLTNQQSIADAFNKCRLVWHEEHKATNMVLICQYLLVH